MTEARAIAAARNAMVDELVEGRHIQTPALERAFRTVARHEFLPRPYLLPADALFTTFAPSDDPLSVYADTVIGLKPEKRINCGAPAVVALQLEKLAPVEGMRVLHVGTGSGYYTALLAEIGGERGSVVGVEYDADLVEMSAAFLARAGYTTVTIRQGDGAYGVPEAAPFDRVLVSAGAGDLAPAWVEQLADDGRLVFPLCQIVPLGPRAVGGVVFAIHKSGEVLSGEFSASSAFFVAMEGACAPVGDRGALAAALQRWFALEEFLRTALPVRVVLKGAGALPRIPAAVLWSLETPNALLWIEPE